MSVIKLSKKKYIVGGVVVRAPSGVYHDGSYWRYVSFSDQGGWCIRYVVSNTADLESFQIACKLRRAAVGFLSRDVMLHRIRNGYKPTRQRNSWRVYDPISKTTVTLSSEAAAHALNEVLVKRWIELQEKFIYEEMYHG